MGRERQKRKNRSSRPKVRPKTVGTTKAGKKKVNFLGNETIAKNWDRSQTLEQNYKRLGLSTKLNAQSSGPRKIKGRGVTAAAHTDSLAIAANNLQATTSLQEVRVERDPETGKILRVIGHEETRDNPLNDPLNDLEDDDEDEDMEESGEENNVVAQLEAQVHREAEIEAKRKRPRQQSTREEEWISRLVEAHREDTAAMFRDRRLNPMQQSQGDIARRLKKWRQQHG